MKHRKPRKETDKKPPPPEEKERDSEDVERAVYDGMQDLRQEKPVPKR